MFVYACLCMYEESTALWITYFKVEAKKQHEQNE